ncbi:SCO2524 family protein [Glycomyces sp. L485]|uniref:SCO2524 family protein n=1 Tax=Glycomyces sp. L485 TaxID=2909235 RepID=UPI001F4B4132|nr:SCO2524 family protein [Glycomyces sp. L485]MCH7231958.1 SCO2524 family protein [Glycomyces sp. L485]
MQPQQQLLDIWRAQVSYCLRAVTEEDGRRHKTWHWGGRNDSDPVGDAQQLLCLLYPAQELPELNYADPDATSDAVLDALGGLGDAVEIPILIMRIIKDYMIKHSDDEGVPSYSGGANMHRLDRSKEASAEQRGIDVTEGFALAIPLCLSSLSFLMDFSATVDRIGRTDLLKERDEAEAMVRRRLVGALTGLLRSFAVAAFDADDDYGVRLLDLINVDGQPAKRIIRRFREQTSDIIATLKDITVGSGGTAGVEAPTKLFEIGWSWSVVEKAPEIEIVTDRETQRPGRAQDAPYLYFTVVALEAITTLFSPRVLRRNLLSDAEQQLVQALQLRLDITRRYWAAIASFGGGSKWPLEDVPWRTTDGLEYDYYSLLVCAVATERFGAARGGDDDLIRLGEVLIELANRGRITRRALSGEKAVEMHFPGVPSELTGIEKLDGPPMVWHMVDYAPLLLKRLLHAASLLNTIDARAEILDVADQVWDHLERRRIRIGPAAKLWDQPGQVFEGIGQRFDDPSWHFTIRIVESMVLAARFAGSEPARSRELENLAQELLVEAEHVYDQELMRGSGAAGPSLAHEIQAVGTTIRHAKDIVGERPGTAFSLGVRALIDLDRLIAAGRDAETGE